MRKNFVFLFIVAFLLGSFSTFFLLPKKGSKVVVEKRPPKGFILVKEELFSNLRDSLFVLSDSLNSVLRKYRYSLTLVAQMKVQLDSLSGSGVSLPSSDVFDSVFVSSYEDSIVRIEYYHLADSFFYTIKPSSFIVNAVMLNDSFVQISVEHLGKTYFGKIRAFRPIEDTSMGKRKVKLPPIGLGLTVNVDTRNFGLVTAVQVKKNWFITGTLFLDKTVGIGIVKIF